MKAKDVAGSFEPIWGEFRGHQVQVYRDGKLVRTGYVEDVMYAGDGLWLESRGIDGRALYTKTEGYSVKALPAATQDDA